MEAPPEAFQAYSSETYLSAIAEALLAALGVHADEPRAQSVLQ